MLGVQTAHHDPFTSSLAGRRLGRYEVLARLASGGMAGVYVARAQGVAGFERLFAIKVLHPHLAHEQEFITMFLDEARLAARIRHPNVVSTIDISDTQDAGYYLVMDYIEGDHLGQLMKQAALLEERLPLADCLRIVVDALSGLSAAHELTDETGEPFRLVHRDVSPQNILVSTDGISRITDFGVAKAESRLATTREGEFKGKLAYMAPEHVSEGHSDQRSDLFAMGIVLWECLTGHRLFRAENQAATLNKVCLEPIPLPSALDPALEPFDAVSNKALQRNPDSRFQSAIEFIEALEKVAVDNGGLGSRRTVANLVKSYAAEKLARERELVRSAIAGITSGEIGARSQSPPPLPAAYIQSISSMPAPPAAGLNISGAVPVVATVRTPPGVQVDSQKSSVEKSRKTGLLIGALGMILAAAVVAFAFWTLSKPTVVTTSPLEKPAIAAPQARQPAVTPEQPTLTKTTTVPPTTPPVEEKPAVGEEKGASQEPSARPEAKSDLTTSAETRRERRVMRRRIEKPAPPPFVPSVQKTAPATTQEIPPTRVLPLKITPSKRSAEDEVMRNPYR
jgi:serine/threonine protein kinase